MEQILALYQQQENSLSEVIAVDLISRAISDKNIFNFGELYDALQRNRIVLEGPATRSTEFSNWIRMLEIFTFGNWQDYKISKDQTIGFPTLDKGQESKLKKLTIVDFGAQKLVVHYQDLIDALDVSETELGPLLIETIYNGLVKGKLDTKHRQLLVTSVFGRDVSSQRLEQISKQLDHWVRRTGEVVDNGHIYINRANQTRVERSHEIDAYNAAVEELNTQVNKKRKSEADRR